MAILFEVDKVLNSSSSVVGTLLPRDINAVEGTLSFRSQIAWFGRGDASQAGLSHRGVAVTICVSSNNVDVVLLVGTKVADGELST